MTKAMGGVMGVAECTCEFGARAERSRGSSSEMSTVMKALALKHAPSSGSTSSTASDLTVGSLSPLL